MLAALLLFGFAPLQQPDAALPGPLSYHLDQHVGVQWRLDSRDSWRAFTARWGGRWGARWDERDGSPRFLWAPGVPLSRAQALLADVAHLAHVDPADLVLAARVQQGERSILRYERRWRGAPVEGDHLSFVAENGRIGAVWAQLSPIHLADQPRAGEIVLPVPTWKSGRPWVDPAEGSAAYLVTRRQDGPYVIYTDRSGHEVQRYDTRRFANVTLTHDERTVGDDLLEAPAVEVTVTDSSGATAITAADGSHALRGALTVALEGPSLVVRNNGADIRVAGTDDVLLEGGVDLPLSATQVQYSFHVLWDWLADRWPAHPWLADQVPAVVGLTDSACNAYYDGVGINFYQGWSGYCNESGRIVDVILHELGHGVHHHILATGTFASDISEGAADFTAATILDSPYLAPEFYPGSPYLRELETDRVYPRDVVGEVHTDGLIWGSFLWDLRERWVDDEGYDAGVLQTDLLFLGALQQGPTLTDAYEAVIVADDDDGDLSNSTPHACDLIDLLDVHGLGPGPIGVVMFDHAPLDSQSSWTEAYEVGFDLYEVTAGCGDLDEDSVQLWYTTGAESTPGIDAPTEGDTGEIGDAYEGWELVPLDHDGDTWTGLIPRQPATTTVRYFMQASSTDGTQTVYTHAGQPTGVYTFRVGDREALWCEGFEAGAPDWDHGGGTPALPDTSGYYTDQWEYGTPTGGSFVPDAPWEGSQIAATALDGFYVPNNLQFLRSPEVQVTDPGPMLLFSFRRWLTVEDGIYDHAVLSVNDEPVWENPASEGGSAHTLDEGWTLQEVDLAPLLTPAGRAQFAWTLSSDPGLEFGGWALDQVCVEQLADVPGHYRVRDFSASDDGETEVRVTWTQPWMIPLAATALVRSRDAWPESFADGVIVDLDLHPVAGEVREVLDADVEPGVVYHYALLAAGVDQDDWQGGVVEGENADLGGILDDEPPVDTAVEDTGDSPVTDDTEEPTCPDPDECDTCEEPDGCGCTTGPARGWPWVPLVLAGLAVRRRR
jgi:MYXO-CTERM domain-containing protein